MNWSYAVLALALALGSSFGCDKLAGGSGDGKNDERKKSDDDDGKDKKKDDAPARTLADEDPFVAKHLELLAKAADCKGKDRIEHWCLIAEGFVSGERGVPSVGVKVGTTTFVVTEDASVATLDKFATLSCLAVRKDGKTFAGITTVKPDNAAEQASVDASREDLVAVFAGERKSIRMTPDLLGYVESLPATAKYPTEKSDTGFKIVGGSNADVRRVKSHWIAVEVPRKNPLGIYVSIFTDRPYEKR